PRVARRHPARAEKDLVMRAEGARKLGSMASHVRPRLVVIAGPTGVGKTAVAVALARLLPIEVISADSRQVYRGMDAATGKPTAERRGAGDPGSRDRAGGRRRVLRGGTLATSERAVRRDLLRSHAGPGGARSAPETAGPGVRRRGPQGGSTPAPGPGLLARAALAPVDRLSGVRRARAGTPHRGRGAPADAARHGAVREAPVDVVHV